MKIYHFTTTYFYPQPIHDTGQRTVGYASSGKERNTKHYSVMVLGQIIKHSARASDDVQHATYIYTVHSYIITCMYVCVDWDYVATLKEAAHHFFVDIM